MSRVSVRVLALEADAESLIELFDALGEVVSTRGPYRNRDARDHRVRFYVELEVPSR